MLLMVLALPHYTHLFRPIKELTMLRQLMESPLNPHHSFLRSTKGHSLPLIVLRRPHMGNNFLGKLPRASLLDPTLGTVPHPSLPNLHLPSLPPNLLL